MPRVTRYHEALRSIPAPGTGCHPSLLSVANYGVKIGIDMNQLIEDIRANIPHGRRRVPDREIIDTVKKAFQDHKGGTYTPRPRPKPVVKDGKTSLQKIISQSKIETDVDLWESSPIRLLDDPRQDFILFFETLYKPDDFIFIGDRIQPGIIGQTIRCISDWITYFKNNGKTSPFIILNPLSGQPAQTKSGDKETLRGDGNIIDWRYCMAEFDNLDMTEQVKFWSAVRLPVIALIYSGGKSIHAILEVKKLAEVTTPEQWDKQIKQRLYDQILKPMGVDGACSNPARLSRLPGHFRSGKNSMQKILWLSSEGRQIENVS